MRNEFVDYLNTLHNEQAGNTNALAEAQLSNPLYRKIQVPREAVNYLSNRISDPAKPVCTIILTGHAGDGKTTILFQVLEKLGINAADTCNKPTGEVFLPNVGRSLRYAKDFSELDRQQRKQQIHSAFSAQNAFTLLVANTGPLIDSFKEYFKSEDTAEAEVLRRIDATSDYEEDLFGHPVLILNILRVDNSDFVVPFAQKLVAAENWTACDECQAQDRCPIRFNAKITRSCRHAFEFVRDFYIWEEEHDNRATIRQISAHIAYALTGGLSCEDIQKKGKKQDLARRIFSNNLFGDTGSPDAWRLPMQIRGVRMMREAAMDQKNAFTDYALFIQRNYAELLPSALCDVAAHIVDAATATAMSSETRKRILKRMQIVFSALEGEKKDKLYADIFSCSFPVYLKYRSGALKPNKRFKDRMCDAINLLFTGEHLREHTIYLTLRRNGEHVQNVQLLIGRLDVNDMECRCFETKSEVETQSRYRVALEYNRDCIDLSLPLIDYLDQIARGMIQKNVDPMLTHGIDNLKSRLLGRCQKSGSEDCVELLVRTDEGWSRTKLRFDDGRITN